MEEKRCYGCMKLKTSSPICEHCGYDERTQNDPHRLPAGTVLKEQYLVGKVLGQGGFGITYLGWDLYLDIPVAIKEYYPSGVVMRDTTVTMDVVSCSGDEGARFRNNKERFLREAKMLARFSQVPEIVQVKNFFLANNTAYIVMEYVEGTTLKQYVADHGGKLSVEETLSILRPVIEALCKVHKAGLVHRDISPDNIMMLPSGGVKLLDFGAVRDVGEAAVDKQLTKSTEAILKQGYAPIEQYQKRGSLGPWTDVYALCATIYYCLTGEVPPDAPERLLGYEDLNLQEKVPSLSEDHAKALEHGMALRAEQRTDSMDTLYQELFRVQPEPETVIATKQEPVTQRKTPVTEQKTGKKAPATERKTEKKAPEKQKKTFSLSKKQKFLIAGIVVVLILICLVPLLSGGDHASAGPNPATEAGSGIVSGECGDNLTWKLENGVLTIEGQGKMDDFCAEPWYSEEDFPYPPWQAYQAQITAVVIGEGVRNVGQCAFCGYDTLRSVQFSSTVEDIGHHAFRDCGLEELELPENLKTIGMGAFSCNPLKKDLVLPDSLESIGSDSFGGCDLLESVTIGPGVRLSYDIWDGNLNFGSQSQNVTIRGYRNTMAEDYAQIMGYPFEAIGEDTWDAEGQCGRTLSYHLDLDTGFLKIDGEGDMWDFNGTWMQSDEHKSEWVKNRELPPWTAYREQIWVVSIGDGVTSIGENAFENCENLMDVYFGNTVERIGTQAFLSTGVDEIVLPESVTKIDGHAFNWCRKLWQLRLPENLPVLENEAIAECINLQELYIGRNTVIDANEELPFTSMNRDECRNTYPNLTIYGLQNSDAERFAGEYGIPFVIGTRGMKAEAEGQCGDDVWWFKSGDTLVLYGTGDTWLYRVNDQEREEWALREWPASWLYYGDTDFYEFRHEIRRILILPGVESLNHRLFCDMDNLEQIDFGTVVSTHCTFGDCGLTEAVLPDTMTFVGEYMFSWCDDLRIVTIQNGSSCVGEGLFAGCTALEEVWFSGKENIANRDLFNPNGNDSYSDHVNFYVKAGSGAERYARENSIPYEIVE